mgnify:CR=1 FL=1
MRAGNFGVDLRRNEPDGIRRELVALPVTAVTTAGVTLYTVPDAVTFQVQSFGVCNYSGGQETFSFHVVPSGSSAGNSNVIYSGVPVAASFTSTPEDRWWVVAPGGSSFVITASADNALNVLFSGMNVYGGDLM